MSSSPAEILFGVPYAFALLCCCLGVFLGLLHCGHTVINEKGDKATNAALLLLLLLMSAFLLCAAVCDRRDLAVLRAQAEVVSNE